jgi:hypothetical protein
MRRLTEEEQEEEAEAVSLRVPGEAVSLARRTRLS